MVQVAAALLFVTAFGLALTVILGMLRANAPAMLSALAGDGAFPAAMPPAHSPAPALRRPAGRLHSRRAPLRTSWVTGDERNLSRARV